MGNFTCYFAINYLSKDNEGIEKWHTYGYYQVSFNVEHTSNMKASEIIELSKQKFDQMSIIERVRIAKEYDALKVQTQLIKHDYREATSNKFHLEIVDCKKVDSVI